MQDKFNKQVFESLPDTVWNGKMPDLDGRHTIKTSFGSTARVVLYTAAIICIPLTIALVALTLRGRDEVPVAAPLAQSEIVYKANNATRADIVLPDSTLVTLNSGSSLKLASDFGVGTRTVELDGEAFFDVRHNKAVPFVILTPQDVKVKVTGTKFNVSCYSDNPKFDLTLLQGSVEVTGKNNETISVQESEQLLMRDGFFNVSRVADPVESVVWKEGTLRFDHTPMREAISRIEKWYGVEFIVEDEDVYHNSISAEFHSETLSEVVRLLCITSRLDSRIKDNTVTLRTR